MADLPGVGLRVARVPDAEARQVRRRGAGPLFRLLRHTPDARGVLALPARWKDAQMAWQVVVGVVAGLALAWLAMLVALRLAAPDRVPLREAVRLLPDLVRLVHRLARDPSLPRGVRVRLGLLLGYLALPVDIVPDFVPVIGFADDAIVVAVVLRSVIRRSGPDAVVRHWPGTPQGLATVLALTRSAP
jgi:uncharacterized membrane protein YkvA (DUF1232 family)